MIGASNRQSPRARLFSPTNARGFTLMEMLVALGIFSVVMATATDIYIMAGRGQRKALNLERVQSDARFTLEAITREVRTGIIDYDYYENREEPISLPDEDLAIVASDNTRIRFFRSDEDTNGYCPDTASIPCVLVKVGASEPASVTPRGVVAYNLKFYISPDVDPNYYDSGPGGGWLSDVQPHVTTVLHLSSTGGRWAEQGEVYIQSTATSRTYRR